MVKNNNGLRSSSNFRIQHATTSSMQKSLLFFGFKLFNKLSNNLKTESNFVNFKLFIIYLEWGMTKKLLRNTGFEPVIPSSTLSSTFRLLIHRKIIESLISILDKNRFQPKIITYYRRCASL